MAEKGRYKDAAQRRLYPIGAMNSAIARPFSAVLAAAKFTPNQVSLLSLLVSVVGLVMVYSAEWDMMAGGALVVYLGLILDHADGQVARRRGMGSTWGMYLDMVIDRVVEIGIIAALLPALRDGVVGRSGRLPDDYLVFGPDQAALLAALTIGVMMLWRFLTAYNDVLFMRSHLLATGQLPAEDAKPQGLARRPLMPLVFNRDWVLLIWLVGVVVAQVHILLALLFVLHVLVCLEKIIVFRFRHKTPEGDARRILGKDYH